MNTSHVPSLRLSLVVAALLGFLCISGCAKSQTPHAVNFPAERAKLASEIEDIGGQHVHMPPLPLDLPANQYLNVTPEFLRDSLKEKVVLIDIWDYTCVNCIQTLPYIKEWNARYKNKGLVIIGVHDPEFEFEKDPKNLDSAVKQFGLDYPIIADNDYKIWNSLANQYWPAKYLFDSKGILRAEHFGEGDYQAFEAFLQRILLERDSSTALPEPVAPVRETDKPGAVCYRATPETYLGSARNHPGNAEEIKTDHPANYHAPKVLKSDLVYFDGPWTVRREYAQPSGKATASLVFDYQAKEANLVIHPQADAGFHVQITQDGKPLAKADRGADVKESDGMTYLEVHEGRMYRITNNQDFGRHTLRLSSDNPSFGAYAFTFTTACKH
ncbi:MAG: redoxin domain-containing protein [Bacteroidota bacterium]|nr:redoxin domain-containing protein [Bacteroidota bacterium]MDP4234096.1 redoxin domain-containing protein [Bacteroidota bacterium]MDP4243037.1 redoxin domain-containing protein [Bacteroidota bacterium]MDP4287463.1 redoxin domain-containing protein [Bacteroidota bacterium]